MPLISPGGSTLQWSVGRGLLCLTSFVESRCDCERMSTLFIRFFRATRMHSADYAVARCLSVCPSHAGIVSKRLHISSKFFHHRAAPPFWFFHTRQQAIFRREPPARGRRMQGCMKKSRFSTNISLYLRNGARWSHIVTMENQ